MLETRSRFKGSLLQMCAGSFDALLQNRTNDFSMCVLDHLSAEQLLFRMNTSKPCGVYKTTARARHENNRRFIAERLNQARCLSEFGSNDNSAVGRSSSTSCDGRNSSGGGIFRLALYGYLINIFH